MLQEKDVLKKKVPFAPALVNALLTSYLNRVSDAG